MESEQMEQTIFFRVHGGEKMGSHDKMPEPGDVIENRYATPSARAVDNIIAYNDQWAAIMRNDPYDRFQKVILIKVEKYHEPKPDVSHDEKTDQAQVVIERGVVQEVMSVEEFRKRYGGDLKKEA